MEGVDPDLSSLVVESLLDHWWRHKDQQKDKRSIQDEIIRKGLI